MKFGFIHNKKKANINVPLECDYLTGLANRGALYNYYGKLNRGTLIHALFVDIDDFKRINDTYGYSNGDELLIKTAELIKKHVDGFVARIGGDEYIALVDGTISQEKVASIVEDLINSFGRLNYRKDILSLVSLSVGIVCGQRVDIPLDEILSKCDEAMYRAKYDGKARYIFYKEFDKSVEINRNIELEMEEALKNGEFKVYMQPKVNMITSKLYGAEALSRWIHPADGIRPPDLYIPLFEKNGFISKLDMYIYEEVCRIKSEWKGKRYEHIPISVNMSRFHLYNEGFADTLTEIADRYGISRNELELEITESVFIKDSDELIRVVNILRSRGFKVSIDDFGSGYSALSLLKDLPVDTIKIDKEFLRVSSENTKGKKVIRNVIAMCRDLKLDIVTEGIETEEQIELITTCGGQIAQGYYYSKPLPVAEFVDFADRHLVNILSSYLFRLNGSLKSEDGSMEAFVIGQGLEYEQGIFKNSKSMHFPGGSNEKNTVRLPVKSIVNDSFTIGMWIKPDRNSEWTAAIYIKFETGFCAMIPSNAEKQSDIRVRISSKLDGWYDVTLSELEEGKWSYYALSYDGNAEVLKAYLNGKEVGTLKGVPVNRYVMRIILGGDVFKESFKGNICELSIYNESKSDEFIHDLYESYINDEEFVG